MEGKTITADRCISERNVWENKKGDYIFGVKDKHEDIKLFLDDPINIEKMDTFETIEKNECYIKNVFVDQVVMWIG